MHRADDDAGDSERGLTGGVDDALRMSEARFRRYFELGLVGMAITSPTKGVLDVNDHLCRLLGYERDELLRKTWAELTHPDSLGADLKQFDRVMAGEIEGYTLDKRWVRKDGNIIDTTISVACVRRDDGSVDYFMGLVQDVTARLRVEQELQRAKEAAEAANRVKSVFLAMMSHELRTPLNAILGYAQLMDMGLHGPLTEAQRHALSRIRHSQQHLLRLIDDILQFTKLDAGQVQLDVADVSLTDCTARLDAILGPQIAAKHLRLSWDVSDPAGAPLFVRADRHRLLQIIVNLVTNAVKYTGDGGAITVSAGADAASAYVRVHDTGCGIPAARLADVFEPFVQLERGYTSPEGVGLGLAISRDLARAMGGDITVESDVGRGSTFTVTLPRAHAGGTSAGRPGDRYDAGWLPASAPPVDQDSLRY
jgi:PAS domain S-box-containing protein